MTEKANTKPTRPGRPAQGKKYPAGLAIMLTTEQRHDIDAVAEGGGYSLGEASRKLLAFGLDLDAAYATDAMLEADVARMAREAGVTKGEALATMLRFAVRSAGGS